MKFNYTSIKTWPPLAWLAKCRPSSPTIEISHGRQVETRKDWFCEAIWDGEYKEGEIDLTDTIFGSGGRLRGDKAIFVSAATTQDRLHSITVKEETYISNSLPCLLAAIGATVDPTYKNYHEDFHTIIDGLKAYKRTLDTSKGQVRLTYYHNLLWDGERLSENEKPRIIRDFSSFEKYRGFLDASLRKLSGNMSDPSRDHPYEMIGTISSGYDAAASVAMARKYGLKEAITFERCRGGVEDSGKSAAEVLGVEPIVREREDWRLNDFAAVPFITVNVESNEVFLRGAENLLKGRVLLAGFHGDKTWGKEGRGGWNEDIPRVDLGGMSISEFRLWTGFISLAVPYLGIRQLEDIHNLSLSEEMKPWDIPTDYSRPIPRRILEEAGLPRETFGIENRAAAVLLFDRDSFLTPSELIDYKRWLKSNAREWKKKGAVPPTQSRTALTNIVKQISLVIAWACYTMARTMPQKSLFSMKERLNDWGDDLRVYGKREYLFDYVFPWAIESAKKHYGWPR